ncbi:pantetheinase-like isoform X3 [Neocloeon triangulifer]|uniref:pantetheinase-like isoform X3 n=1 Tax=Neocloeon triangulifer TaxID=2078957 RepID=UPI00286EBDC2|nr:pantetheinase-like isoform X3 [Neocloeon triangulifer]
MSQSVVEGARTVKMLSGMARPAMALLLLGAFQVHQVHSYVAAVVEFSPDGITGPLVPSLIFSNNLRRYEEFVVDARKTYAADIIVFPEYGLTTTYTSNNRSLALEFAQIVPDKNDNIIPCTAYNDTFEYEAVRRLSCMARDNGIYLVANLIEKVDKPGAGVLLHNTNVAFDSAGTVVSRYRKFNLFGEFALNLTDISDISVFDALGARFGMITCFDLMFQQPAVELVKTYGVTDIIFPTAWIHELPFLTGPQAQAAFAYGNQVNVLASGYNEPEAGHTGSGIYLGKTAGDLFATIEQNVTSKLVVAEVPTQISQKLKTQIVNRNNIERNGINPFAQKPVENYMLITEDNLQDYTAVPVPKNMLKGTIQACDNMLCCNLTFEILNKDVFNFHYQLLAFDGIRTHLVGRYETEMQVCALVACADDTKLSCSNPFTASSYSELTEFGHIKIEAEFKSTLLWPNTVDADTMLPLSRSAYDFQVDNTTNLAVLERSEPITNVHTFAIYSHDYIK